ncbi:MAG: ATP-binding protein, partial [Methanothrix sp.]|nr:ATP-binding protein [Methanothrix sp.]
HIQTHRGLVERICRDLEIELLLPIWKKDSYDVLKEIIDSGFKVVVVSVRDGLLGREWLGRSIDEGFVSDLLSSDRSIDPCGENGEFHTLVVDGPIFKKRIEISKSDPKFQEGYWSMNIREFAVREK